LSQALKKREDFTRLRAVLDASASFTNFATEYLCFLSDREIRPGIAAWSAEREFIANRLKTELFNQAFGVEKGDEVEAQRAPVILKAIEVIGG
jgi:hypothetical protein